MGETIFPDDRRLKISAEDVRSRLRDHVYVMYSNYAFFIKGAVTAIAGVSIFGILAAPDNYVLEKMALWGASYAFSLVTLATWARGATLTGSRANVFDIFWPLTLGMLEVLLFVALASPALSPNLPVNGWTVWYLIMALHAFSAFFLVSNRFSQIQSADFVDDQRVQLLVEHYKRWVHSDRIGTALTGTLAIIVYIACRYCPFMGNPHEKWGHVTHVTVGIILTIVALLVIRRSTKQLEIMARA